MTCVGCEESVGGIVVERVLPLPSGGWRDNCKDWYCCVNKISKAPDMGCRPGDLLYNSHSLAILRSNMSIKVSAEVVFCQRCGIEIGSLDKDIVLLWIHAVLLKGSGSGFRQPNKVLTPLDTFLKILNSWVMESITLMPRFIVQNRAGEALLLWVVDKSLKTFHSEVDSSECDEKTVTKILIKSEVPDSD